MEPDFSGWATKANLKCSDGRTILPNAFKHMDGQQVPLVYQHGHTHVDSVLGHAILRHLPEGVRADCYFNDTSTGQTAKKLVKHKDITKMSIFANSLVQQGGNVVHGDIKEVSLVLAGANSGAVIDPATIKHADGSITEIYDAATIFTGLDFIHTGTAPDPTAPQEPATPTETEQTPQQIFDSMTPVQQDFVAYAVEKSVENATTAGGTGAAAPDPNAQHSGTTQPNAGDNNQEGTGVVTHQNVFERGNQGALVPAQNQLSHDDMRSIFQDCQKPGATFHEVITAYAAAHGIENIGTLFPDPKNLDLTPQFNSRRMEWVQGIISGTSKTPFSNVRSIVADITQDQARALGYVKGTLKKAEWFSVTKRTTQASTVIKKQHIDRDDVVDITDFDVVAWMKVEMDLMLREDIARAILVGDGREVDDPDKIPDPGNASSGAGVRSIINEHELYKTDINVNLTATPDYSQVVDGSVRGMRYYKGTGTPTFYTTLSMLANLILMKDGFGRRLYANQQELAAAMMVDSIVTVEVMENIVVDGNALIGIIVNIGDYTIGANKGGEVTLFDFFDIDFNILKYLSETRMSGALRKIKSALVMWGVPVADVLVVPTTPTWVKSTGVVTVPTKTGVTYKDDTGATLTAGAQTALTAGQSLTVVATPATGYYFATGGTTVETVFTVPPTAP